MRRRRNEYLPHPGADVADQWAMIWVRREFYTAASDALGQLHPLAPAGSLADVAPHGSTVRLPENGVVALAPQHTASLARQRTSWRLAA